MEPHSHEMTEVVGTVVYRRSSWCPMLMLIPSSSGHSDLNGAKGRVGVYGGAIVWEFVPFKASAMMIKNK